MKGLSISQKNDKIVSLEPDFDEKLIGKSTKSVFKAFRLSKFIENELQQLRIEQK
jgi:hypothetical protein